MKLLFDENLSPRLTRLLADLFPGSQHVRDVALSNSGDALIWDFARREGFVIISKDSDFYDRATLVGAPPKVIFLQIGNCSTERIRLLIRDRFSVIADFISAETADCLLLSYLTIQTRSKS